MLRNEVHSEVPLTCSPNWSLPSYGYLEFATRRSDDPSAGNEAMPESTEVTFQVTICLDDISLPFLHGLMRIALVKARVIFLLSEPLRRDGQLEVT